MPSDTRAADAEVAVVGSMLIDERCIGDVLAAVGPEDFENGTCRATFRAMKSLFEAGRPVDMVTVIDAMHGGDGYTEFVRDAMTVTPTAANVLDYCRIVRDTARHHRLVALARKIVDSDDLETAREIVPQLDEQLVDKRDSRIMSAQEWAADFVRRLKSAEKPDYLTWGLPSLDKKLLVELGDVVLLGGYPSSGKTLLSLLFAIHLAEEYRVGYYSLETRNAKLADRAMASQSRVGLGDIKRRLLPEQSWMMISDAVKRTAALNLDFVEAAGYSVADVFSTARSRRHQIIVIDYIQLLTSPGANRYEQVTNISKELALMARSNRIAVLELAQLTRPEKRKDGSYTPPSMASFRESGQIEQDADVAMLLYPEDPGDNASHRVLKVSKNKEGEKAGATLAFYGSTQTMEELEGSAGKAVAAKYSAAGRSARYRSDQVKFEELDDDTPVPFEGGGETA